MMAAPGDAKVRTKLSAPLDLRVLTQAGSKVRTKLSAMLPVDRAAFFMAIEAERARFYELSVTKLCGEAGVSPQHYERLVRTQGRGVTARLIVTLARALKTMRVEGGRPASAPLVGAAYRGCLAAACAVTGDDIGGVTMQLSRAGEFPADASWRAASKVRATALYLASTELGIRQRDLAPVARLTPAAICYALQKIEGARDDEAFDAALDRAAEQVRGV